MMQSSRKVEFVYSSRNDWSGFVDGIAQFVALSGNDPRHLGVCHSAFAIICASLLVRVFGILHCGARSIRTSRNTIIVRLIIFCIECLLDLNIKHHSVCSVDCVLARLRISESHFLSVLVVVHSTVLKRYMFVDINCTLR